MKSTLSALALAAAASLANVPASSAIVVTFTPATSHINVGDNVNVDVSISGLGAEVLSAVDLNFLFSGGAAAWGVADFSSLTSALGAGAFFTFDTINAGEIGIQAGSVLDDAALAAAQADSFLIGTFTMHGVSDGVTNIAFGADPDFQRLFVGLNALTLDVQVGTACIGVGTGSCDGGADVPEPATLGLLGMGLLGLAGLRRRQAA